MYDTLLIIHFFGLAIGAGTPFYMAAMARHVGKSGQPQQIKQVMLGPGGAVAMVGAVGLVLMLISGVGMYFQLGNGQSLGMAFTVKMVFVGLIIIYVGTMKSLSKRAGKEEGMATMGTIKKLSPIGPVLSVVAICAAVVAFH